jgi:cytochrome c peroxidase
MRFPTVIVVLATLPASVASQTPVTQEVPDSKKALIALGESLFNDPRLSSTGTMSCATCHRADRSFTEDKRHAVGQSGLDLGRNTPTLFGLGSVKEFPVGGSRGTPPKMVSLEERVVVPLRDETEMCGRVGEATDRLTADPSCVVKFNAVFEEPGADREPFGITGDRVARALAEYVRSLRHWEGPTHAALAGADVALEEPVKRGLEVFRGEGRCQSCHSGPALTDGSLYVVALRPRVPDLTLLARAESRETRAARVVRSGGYGGREPSLERQTLTLLDARRTGPYFRDGAVVLLSDAVRRHVTELREVGAARKTFFVEPALTSMGSASRAPSSFSASVTAQLASDAWIPKELTARQLDDVVAFLGSLSPGD